MTNVSISCTLMIALSQDMLYSKMDVEMCGWLGIVGRALP